MRIRVHGCERSGTNVLASLLEASFPDVEVDQRGKHGPHLADDADGYVVVAKEPWAWLLSFKRFQEREVWDVPERWWRTLRGQRFHPVDAKRYLELYANSYLGWRRSVPEPRAWVGYEDLLADPPGTLAAIAADLDLPAPDPTEPVGGRVTSSGDVADEAFDASYYLEKRYLRDYDAWSVPRILEAAQRDGLDEALLALGYDLAASAPRFGSGGTDERS